MDRSSRNGTFPSSTTRIVDVQVPVAIDHAYSYRVSSGMEVRILAISDDSGSVCQ